MDKIIDWTLGLKKEIPLFMDNMRGGTPGYYKYSYSGDLNNQDIRWGLGNTVFALKILYVLGKTDEFSEPANKAVISFIDRFKTNEGLYFDPVVKKYAVMHDVKYSIRNFNFYNLFHYKTMIAETRQTLSSLRLINEIRIPPKCLIPANEIEVKKYINSLEWNKPWAGGSHFSHLLFFLEYSNIPERRSLIEYAVSLVDEMCSPLDGSWYKGNPDIQQKINGAMKVLTGFKAAGLNKAKFPEKLIDLCLNAKNDAHACDNFNIVFVLNFALKQCDYTYRIDEARQFCINRLYKYYECYHHEEKGFSFYKNQANRIYYGAKISKGLDEPDIHGTCLYMWGISIIDQILGINAGFREFNA